MNTFLCYRYLNFVANLFTAKTVMDYTTTNSYSLHIRYYHQETTLQTHLLYSPHKDLDLCMCLILSYYKRKKSVVGEYVGFAISCRVVTHPCFYVYIMVTGLW